MMTSIALTILLATSVLTLAGFASMPAALSYTTQASYIADSQTVTTTMNTPLTFYLTGSAPQDFFYRILTAPDVEAFCTPEEGYTPAPDVSCDHSYIEYDGETGQVWYTPKTDFVGTDSFTFETAAEMGAESGDVIGVITIVITAAAQEEGTHTLNINAQSKGGGDELHMWTVIDNLDTSSAETGFTPMSVVADSSATLEVTVYDYQEIQFDQWEDNSTDRTRTITLNSDTTITAFYTTGTSETIHMEDRTASAGYGVYELKPARVEYVTEDSQLVGDKIDSITLQLKRVHTVDGTAEIGVLNEDLSVKKLFGTLDVSTLTQQYADYEFKLTDELYTIEAGDRIGIKYDGSSGSNWVSVMLDLDPEDPFDGANSYLQYHHQGSWKSSPDRDMYMILKETYG
jgi:hypothetical protein